MIYLIYFKTTTKPKVVILVEAEKAFKWVEWNYWGQLDIEIKMSLYADDLWWYYVS